MKTNSTGAGAGAHVSNPIANSSESEKKSINVELWQACAGPLVNLPAAGTHVVYFPQGHSEQVAASMKKDVDAQTPNYPNLPSKLLCLLHNVTLHADPETDEVYAQMTLQPVPSFDKEALLRSDLSMKQNKPQPEFFCKTLTASDTSTHGGFSVPRRAAEKIFPPLDFSMQPPAQELVAKDLHDNMWTLRHIYRGQPKRHLLTTGWSLFVSGKRLFAGDSVLFIRDDKQQLLLGVRRATRQPANLSSSVLSSDSMHIGILAAAAHAAANNSPFTVFYNPRASPSEFVIPLAKYYKAVCSNQVSLGMRFRMLFETEESGTRRYMGTITGISDLDPLRWKNSQWRNLLVNWDESTAGDKRNRVSTWEIEPVTAPFFICPTPSLFRPKRPRQPGMPDDDYTDLDGMLKRTMPWLGGDVGGIKDTPTLPGLSLVQWMNMQQNSSLANSIQPSYLNSMSGSALQNLAGPDLCRQLGLPGAQVPQQNNMQFTSQRPPQQSHLDQLQKLPASQLNQLASIISPQQQLVQAPNVSQQQQPSLPLQRNLPINMQPSQSLLQTQSQQRNFMVAQTPERVSQQMNISETQIQLQYLQKLQQQQQQQQQTYLAQQSAIQQPPQHAQMYEQPKQSLDVPQNFSRSVTYGRMGEVAQAAASSSHSHAVPEQLTMAKSQNNVRLTVPPDQVKLPQQLPGLLPELQEHGGRSLTPTNPLAATGCGLLANTAGGGQSGITDEVPSCSTSPSANNSRDTVQPIVNGMIDRCTPLRELNQTSATVLNSNRLKAVSASGNIYEELQQKSEKKPSLNASKNQHEGFFSQHNYACASGAQMEYLDTSSSATSVCISQNDVRLPQNANQMSFNSQPALFRDTTQGLHEDHGNLFGSDINNQFGMQMMNDPVMTKGVMGSDRGFLHDLASTGDMLSGYENLKESQPEPSSSIVSQSFGVPDMTFNSRDSAVTDNGFTNRGAWGAAQQMPCMRTYTKVYKRGAVGRSIDIARYSGYEELKQDLARRFGIEGQLEDRQRIGWKLVYVDHENDVLLVGDDPWEEFVSCVRCIKILSPQEVQQMSLDGDLGNSLLQNQACSSSEGGNVELAT